MLNVISFSGGLGSAISAIIAHEEGLNYELVFADTLIEDEDLYRFIIDVSDRLGKKIHWLKDGRSPWDVFVDVRYMGNSRTAHCSKQLKTDIVQQWVHDFGLLNAQNHQQQPFRLILGMDFSEMDRIDRAKTRWAKYCDVASLLNEYKVYRPTWGRKLKEYDLEAPRLYSMGFPHNNCGGMCVRAGLKQFQTLLQTLPEVYNKHEKEQERVMLEVPNMRPFLRKTINGELSYLTLKEFREKINSGEIRVDPYDWGGCGCFID